MFQVIMVSSQKESLQTFNVAPLNLQGRQGERPKNDQHWKQATVYSDHKSKSPPPGMLFNTTTVTATSKATKWPHSEYIQLWQKAEDETEEVWV